MRNRGVITVARSAAAMLCAIAALPSAAAAQLETPPDWRYVTDAPAELVTGEETREGTWRFVAMPPGWHITTGPGALLWDPSHGASDRFSLEAEIFLFPQTGDEGWGLFLGGRELDDEASRAYTAVLLRADGAVGVFRNEHGAKQTVVDWTPADAAGKRTEGDVVGNVLRVDAERDSVTVSVNESVAVRFPRDAAPIDGPFGLRVGAESNLHIGSLDLTVRLAEPPGG